MDWKWGEGGNKCQNYYIYWRLKIFWNYIYYFIFHFGNFLAQIALFSMVVYTVTWVYISLYYLYLPTYTHGPPITISQVFSSHSILKVVPCSFYIQFHTTHLFRWKKKCFWQYTYILIYLLAWKYLFVYCDQNYQ